MYISRPAKWRPSRIFRQFGLVTIDSCLRKSSWAIIDGWCGVTLPKECGIRSLVLHLHPNTCTSIHALAILIFATILSTASNMEVYICWLNAMVVSGEADQHSNQPSFPTTLRRCLKGPRVPAFFFASCSCSRRLLSHDMPTEDRCIDTPPDKSQQAPLPPP